MDNMTNSAGEGTCGSSKLRLSLDMNKVAQVDDTFVVLETEFEDENFDDYRETEDEMDNLQALMGPSTKNSKKPQNINVS